MAIQFNRVYIFERYPTLAQLGWDEYLAHGLSIICTPALMVLGGAALIAYTLATPAAWQWLAIYSILVVLLPILYLVWLFRRGQVSDLDVYVRRQRFRPLFMALTGVLTAWLVLYWGAGPRLLLALAGANVIQLAIILGITLRWKISMHATGVAGFVVMACMVIGSAAWPLILLAPAVAWARVRLRCHTLAQTVAGAALGSSVLAAALFIYGG
jgi:membrane-associated phospholipid phosphatase